MLEDMFTNFFFIFNLGTGIIVKVVPIKHFFAPISIPFIIVFVAPGLCESLRPTLRHAFSNEYLPQNFVYSICEDHRGFLWLGTLEGLADWDGHEMKVYRHIMNDANSLPSNDVIKVFEDKLNWLWIETSRGWARLDPGRDLLKKVNCNGTIFKGKRGSVWCISNGSLERFNYGSNSFVDPTPILPPVPYRDIWVAQNGTLWAYGNDRNLYSKDGGGWVRRTKTAVGLKHVQMSFKLDKSTYLLKTSAGLVKLSTNAPQIERLSGGLRMLAGKKILGLDRAPNDRVWIVTSRHVYDYNPVTETCRDAKVTISVGITAQDVFFCLFVDRQGIVWVGSIRGVYEYDPSQRGFSNISLPPVGPSLAGYIVLSIAKGRNGNLWVGTYGRGLYDRNERTGAWREYRSPKRTNRSALSNDVVWSIGVGRDGQIWAGTDDGLNLLLDKQEGDFKQYFFGNQSRSPGLNTVTLLRNDQEGDLWCGTYSGLLFNIDSNSTSNAHNVFDVGSQIRSLDFQRDSIIWVGTAKGLFLCNTITGRVQPIDRFNGGSDFDGLTIWSITSYTNWTLALGTNEGLILYGVQSHLLRYYGLKNGFPSSNVFSALPDAEGRLWCSTNRGLARIGVRVSDKDRALVYDWTDGIENLEFNRGAYLRGPGGHLYFGGDKGVTVVDPDQVHEVREVPKTIITKAVVTYPHRVETYDFPNDTLDIGFSNLTLRLRFVAPIWYDPLRVAYLCKLIGVEDNWANLGDEGRVQYSLLAPGTYLFRVRALSPQGIMDSTGVTLCLIVAPPFWATAWFRVITALAVFGSLIVLVRSIATRSQRKKVEILKLRNRILEQERVRFSRDIHDEIGTGLTEIAVISEVARSGVANIPAEDSFRKLAAAARDLTSKLGEIVWSIDPRRDSLTQFVDYFRDRTYQYIEGLNLKVKWLIPEILPDLSLSSNIRRNLLLICKECVTNIVKHSGATQIEIRLSIEDGEMQLSISDNGRGISEGLHAGNGLRNIEERAVEVGGKMTIESRSGEGARVTLKIPLQRMNEEGSTDQQN